MASTLGISLGALFFLLIPGLAGLKTFLRTYVQLDDLSRVDKLALSGVLGGGTLGLVLLFLNWDCWSTRLPELLGGIQTGTVTQWSNDEYWCDGEAVVTLTTIESLPIVAIIGMIGVQSIIASVGGGLAGWYLNHIEDGPSRESKYIEQPWEFVSKNTFREEESATVITVEGEEIKGTVHRLGTPSEDYDILLASPTKILRDRNDNVIKRRDLGDYSYHHYQDISQVQMNRLERDFDAKGPQDDDYRQSELKAEEDSKTESNNEAGGLEFEVADEISAETEDQEE
ncbi:hypothetical protein [Natrinema sp. HArc-T2]|uniref:hypothetical protein n=1 Tax=Natrinema sp. HArc-T2 TaxID=3242701 RepID=UPI00359ECD23